MGRPPKPENLKRSKMLPLRLTEDEWNYIAQASRETGVSISDILRKGAILFVQKRDKDGSRKPKEKKKR
jgi:hypothetical protein